MEDRITRNELHMRIAQLISQRATCKRGKVGCIIIKNNRTVSSGYNGVLHGDTQCSSENCNLEQSCVRAVHAELNAIAAAARHGISLEGCTLICTTAPCINCAMAIAQSGITHVVYGEVYKSPLGLRTLDKMNITHEKYELIKDM